ncbi:hypothetical protein KY290_033746 [Solanum tuberosum]|uniref:DUF4371 domain-containing protein n=1 Tax=Solanum tuberosum TaxID=4113 RepID=A0ABQ7U303_SOLTU|nr:hypothetical protein KY289_033118 [Solanum tuberosum]KAH0647756.1 hypothetical protein KY285_033004 [Solanum tuberosum]KAH0740703.1 hypothetical protein KY290_033746 [Solanum tuberosum]
MQQRQSIRAAFDRQSDQIKLEYWTRLNASIDVIRLLLNQGLPLRSHDESESSLNKDIQKELVTEYKIETLKSIMEDLNGDYFALLVDESFDVSRKE